MKKQNNKSERKNEREQDTNQKEGKEKEIKLERLGKENNNV